MLEVILKSWSVWLVFVILVAWLVFNSGNDQTQRTLAGFKRAVSNVLSSMVVAWSKLLLGIPGIGAFVRARVNAWTDERVQAWMQKHFANDPDPNVSASWKTRMEIAMKRYPPERYPTLWMDSIPDDLSRSLIQDGRLITGDPISRAAEASITTEHQGVAWRSGMMAAILWFSLLAVVWQPALFFTSTKSARSAQAVATMQALSDDQVALTLRKDYWSAQEKAQAVQAARANAQSTYDQLQGVGMVMGLLDPVRLLFPLFFACLMGILAFRGSMSAALATVGKGFHDGTKEQTVRWKFRMEQRHFEYRAYFEQLRRATEFDNTPLITLGEASGVFRFRGRLDAPYPDQPMKISLLDLHQNMLIIGGTGSGKTRAMIKPMIKQMLQIRLKELQKAKDLRVKHQLGAQLPATRARTQKLHDEFEYPFGVAPVFSQDAQGRWSAEIIDYPLELSMYVTDGKAVLYQDLEQLAQKSGQAEDLMVVGPGEGEYSVDLLDGQEPQLVSDTIKSVARQSGGGGGKDDFWPDMAAEVVRNCAVVARVFDLTPEGLQWAQVHRERPYSLVFIYQLAMDHGPLVQRVLEAILNTLENSALSNNIRPYATTELQDAMLYLSKSWLPMVQSTRDGIKANITNVMGGFASNVTLRRSFSSGAGERLVSVDQFWGRLVVTNISTLDYGVAGRIINVFLKTLFMTEAVKRQKRNTDELNRMEKKFFERYPELSIFEKTLETLHENKTQMPHSAQKMVDDWYEAATQAHHTLSVLAQAHGVYPMEGAGVMFQLDHLFGALQAQGVDLSTQRPLLELVESTEAEFKKSFPELVFERKLLSEYRDKLNNQAQVHMDATLMSKLSTDREGLELYVQWRTLSTKIDRREKMYFFADEYQTLITVDTKEGAQSDSSFWNVSRSSGVAGIIATQSYATLKQAIGEASDNFSQQMRSKIFLPVEDPATFEFIKKLAGKSMRSYTYDDQEYESYDAMLFETRARDPFLHGTQEVAVGHADPADPQALQAAANGLFRLEHTISANDAIVNVDKSKKIDTRFYLENRTVTSQLAGTGSNIDQMKGSEQAATWRAEDKRKSQLSEGNQEQDVFREDDFLEFGQNHAYAYIQRAGKSRQDIIRLNTV